MKRFAKPYADVLLEAASASGSQSVLADELAEFAAALEGSPELQKLALNPAVTPADKEKFLDDFATRAKFGDLTKRVLVLLVRNNRLGDVAEILAGYREILDRSSEVAHARVRVASALDPAQRQKLEAALERAAGMKVRMTIDVDRSLIAGVVAQIGSTVFDASVRGEIRKIKRALGVREEFGASSSSPNH